MKVRPSRARLHLGCTSAAPRLHLGCISDLGCISAASRRARVVERVDVSPVAEQPVDDRLLAGAGGLVQRGVAVPVPLVDVHAVLLELGEGLDGGVAHRREQQPGARAV